MNNMSSSNIESLDKCDIISERFLFDLFSFYRIFPNNKMNKGAKLNTCIRFVLLLSLLLYLSGFSLWYYFLIFSIIFIIGFSFSSKESFDMSPDTRQLLNMQSYLPLSFKHRQYPFDFRTDNIPSQPEYKGDIVKDYGTIYPRSHYGNKYDNDSWGIKSQQDIIGINTTMNDINLPTYFTPNLGHNPIQDIKPIIINRLTEDSVWDAPINVRGTINKRYTEDITELELPLTCTRSDGSIIPDCQTSFKDIKIASPYSEDHCPYPPKYSLGTPIKTVRVDNYFKKPDYTDLKLNNEKKDK